MAPPSPQPNLAAGADDPPRFDRRFWLLVLVGGVGAGLAGGGLMALLNVVQHLAWPYDGSGDGMAAYTAASAGRRVAVLAAAGVWVGVTTAVVRRWFGTGTDVNAAIWHRAGHVPVAATLARGLVSIVGVGLGMSLGREAAVKQAGGAVASGLGQWARLPDEHRRVLVACGVGAGMAAAYNVPLGGALFALEVLLGTASLRLVMPAVAMATLATMASWTLLPTTSIYVAAGTRLTRGVLVWALLAGPAFGVVGVGLLRAVVAATRVKWAGAAAVVAPVVALTLLGVVAVGVPQVLGNGKEVVQLAFDGRLTLTLLLVLPVLKVAATAGCLASGARGGLFTPTMMVGAVFGQLLGRGWDRLLPGTSPELYAMIGAAAVLAAASQGPVSAVVLVLELTRHGDATMVPMLLAVGGATATAGWLDGRSIYSARATEPEPPSAVSRRVIAPG